MPPDIIRKLLGLDDPENDSDTGTTMIPAYKTALALFHTYLQDNFDPISANTDELTRLRSDFIDRLLTRVWQQYFRPDQTYAALVAVGGYGRRELFPGSDIDLMILTGCPLTQTRSDRVQKFLAFLWDIGLDIGHSVRTIREVHIEAEADITIVTNVMESRRLLGNSELFLSMKKSCAPDKIWPSQDFFQAKHQEQKQRHKKFNDTAYNLEPNVKEGLGGLRDIQNIGWVTKRHFGVDSLQELVNHGYLTNQEYKILRDGLKYLGTLRMALHLHTGKREDRILFDYQHLLATRFGYIGKGNEVVEAFMQQYFRTVLELQPLNEMLLQHFQDDIDLNSCWSRKQTKPINQYFRSCRGFIETTSNTVFKNNPLALLEIFLILQRHPELKGVTAATIRLIRQHRDLIDANYRNDPRAKSLFMEILRQPTGITHELRRMNRYGILATYLPEFANITGRMQYDLLHAYTVDEHTLFVVRNIRRFTIPEYQHEFPLCSHIMATLPKPELIYIAALYHDIGKGRGGDHSKLGAIDARRFCQRHGLSDYDTDLVSWLVENHLLMSQTSHQQDTTDTEVVYQFASKVADSVRLNYLYVLTVADIRATNPSAWSSWKENLLNELYNATNRLYRHSMVSSELGAYRLNARRKESYELLRQAGIDGTSIHDFWSRLPDKYFLRHAMDDIVWHTRSLIEKNFSPTPIVCCRSDSRRGVTAIFIYANDQKNLFAHTASVLSRLNLNVLDARILETNDSFVLNTFIVHNNQGLPIIDTMDIKSIEDRVNMEISLADAPIARVKKPILRILKQFAIRTHIEFEQNSNNRHTALRLNTTDRPGILSQVGQVFIKHNIRLHTAHVATFGERVEDVFYITTPNKRQITDPKALESLRQSIIQALSS